MRAEAKAMMLKRCVEAMIKKNNLFRADLSAVRDSAPVP